MKNYLTANSQYRRLQSNLIDEYTLLKSVPRPFWCTQAHIHNSNCDFNHFIGLPLKYDDEKPIYLYETDLVRDLLLYRYIAINKATGVGATEILLRAFLWMALTFGVRKRQIAIVTGTEMKFAIQLIQQRLKPMIERKHGELIKTNVREKLILPNENYFRAYPTDHIDDMRGQDDIWIVFIDEAGFFHPNRQEQVLSVVERYKPKMRPFIVWNSTPNGAVGAFYEVYTNAIKKLNDYYPITIHYREALGKILDPEEIEKLRVTKGRLFSQEYENQFLAPMGALFGDPVSDVKGISL